MTDLAKLVVRLEAQSAQMIAQLEKSEKRVKRFERKAVDATRNIKQVFAALGVAAIGKAFIDATTRQEDAIAQLEQRLKSTGGVAGQTSSGLQALAQRLQQLTTFSDEAVMEMQALLLTFTNVRGPIFTDANTAILNVATALKTDLKSAALQVGKALNDPIKGVSALAESGIQFTDQQKKMIVALTQSGRVADAQRLILAELETQFGGAAQAAGQTFGGALEQLRNAAGDLLEGKGGLNDATQGVRDLTATLQGPAVQDGFQLIVSGVIKATTSVIKFAAEMGKLAKGVGEFFARLAGGPATLVDVDREIANLQTRIEHFQQRTKVHAGGALARLADEKIGELRAEQDKLKELRKVLTGEGLVAPAQDPAAAGGATPTPPGGSTLAPPSADAQKMIDGLREQVALFGLSADAALRYKLELAGATPEQLRMADALMQTSAQQNAQQALQESLTQAAERSRDVLATTTAAQREYASSMTDLSLLLAHGKISQDQFNAAVEKLDAAYDKAVAAAENGTSQMTALADQAARNLLSGFSEFLVEPFEKGLDGMVQSFGKMLQKMAADLAASQLLQALGNALLGGPMDTLGKSLLAGARADGGPVTSGRAYLVGERGPEIMVPGSSGMVLPNESIAGGGGAMVQVNIINQAGGTRVSQRERETAGGLQIDVLIEQIEGGIARNINRGGGLAPTLEGRYRLNPAASALT
jgi:phage-related minor tail protein